MNKNEGLPTWSTVLLIFFGRLTKICRAPIQGNGLFLHLCIILLTPQFAKEIKHCLPNANTHSIVKQNYVKKLKRKRKNIQYKKRERKKGKENYLPRQYNKSEFLHNCQFNQLQQVASSKKSFSCRSKKIVLIKYSLSFNWLN